MSTIKHPEDLIDEIVQMINEYETYADKNNQKIVAYEQNYRIMLQNVMEKNEIDETSCREIKNCLNRLLHTTTQISLERIKLVEIEEKINKIIYETNSKKRSKKKKNSDNL
uniref:ING domain-containing protein n=1 Tax=Strongyloides papillosus TaxID=174720 RepID=A0A0N5B6R3_STREA